MKITIKEKDGILLYKVGRKIICFVSGICYAIGCPSSACAAIYTCENEEDAREEALKVCQRRVLSCVKKTNPMEYEALKILYDID